MEREQSLDCTIYFIERGFTGKVDKQGVGGYLHLGHYIHRVNPLRGNGTGSFVSQGKVMQVRYRWKYNMWGIVLLIKTSNTGVVWGDITDGSFRDAIWLTLKKLGPKYSMGIGESSLPEDCRLVQH